MVLLVAAIIGGATVPAEAAAEFDDVSVIYRALNNVLENNRIGAVSRWRNAETGNRGTIKPVRTFFEGSAPCRDYERTYRRQGGAVETIGGTACRSARGVWKVRKEWGIGPSTPSIKTAKPAPDQRPTPPALGRSADTQRLLAKAGLYKGPVDGVMSARTRTAILEYQRKKDPAFNGRDLEQRLAGAPH